MITMNDIDLFLRIPVSPVFINALVLFNDKLLPTLVNHTKNKLVCYQNIEANIVVSKLHINEAILFFL